jgi:hypothetical protein
MVSCHADNIEQPGFPANNLLNRNTPIIGLPPHGCFGRKHLGKVITASKWDNGERQAFSLARGLHQPIDNLMGSSITAYTHNQIIFWLSFAGQPEGIQRCAGWYSVKIDTRLVQGLVN